MTDVASEPRSFAVEGGERAEHGAVLFVPLNRLKKSPKNVRQVPHTAEEIEQFAASIAARKGVQPTQPLVVEPEVEDGKPTGAFLVTAGEGRRLGLALLVKQKLIKKTHAVRCILDLENDPAEVSLGENVVRVRMHPADEFEAFRDQQDRRGLSADEIAVRFGVKPQVVRQRLRMGTASPALLAAYRAEAITLEHLMAYCLTDDHARQEQVFARLGATAPFSIRKAITEDKAPASDRRVQFVGVEAYAAAGGPVLRDLFTEQGAGWAEDVALLDRMVLEKLEEIAAEVRAREGWKWAEAHMDYPHGHGFGRVYPGPLIHTDAEREIIARLGEEQDALASQWEAVDELPPDVEERFAEIEAELLALDAEAYASEDMARAGVIVVLSCNGEARIERGLVRPEDELPEPDEADGEGDQDPDAGVDGGAPAADEPEEGPEDGAPLSERLVLDLTAQRTLALRDALGASPTVALAAVTHALALAAFYPPYERAGCLEVKLTTTALDGHAPGIGETKAGRGVDERHEAWAKRMPRDAADAWGFVLGLGSGELLELLAHCASLSVNAVRTTWDRKPKAWGHADALAGVLDLDMTAYWTPTVDSYLGRVTKARIAEAVSEAVSPEAAERIAGLKKPDMALEAEALMAGKGWLPTLLRRPEPAVDLSAAA